MYIHFVCTGNGYRSRLAEAYLKSKVKKEKIIVTSSGIAAEKYKYNNGPICWYAMRLIIRNDLTSYMSWKQNQTTRESLKDVDLLICMRDSHLDYCQKELNYGKHSFEIWDIPDLDEMEEFISSKKPNLEEDANLIKLTEKTFKKIVKKTDNLIKRLKGKF